MSDQKKLLFEKETYAVIGCAIRVHTELGPGLGEKVYERAMAVDLNLQKIPYTEQAGFVVHYQNIPVGKFVPDFVVFDSLIVEVKTVPQIGDNDICQVLTYLRVTGKKVGIILNFNNRSLEWKRIVLSNE